MKVSEEVLSAYYEPAVEPARQRLQGCRALRGVFTAADSAKLARFMIYFSAYGVGMTEPVPGWIRRAGERCIALDWPELGAALCAHARHEEGHHELMIDDLRKLTSWYAEHYSREFDADTLLAVPQPSGVSAYQKLHEDVIASHTPFTQIAIEYEIEALSVRVGPLLLELVAGMLGPKVLGSLSFVHEHVAQDVGHTRFNREQLARLVTAHPDVAPRLAETGSRALDAYASFLDDCWAAAGQRA